MTDETLNDTSDSVNSNNEVPYGKVKYDRITVSLDKESSKLLEIFIREVRDTSGYKIAKSDIIRELIKLLPDMNLIPFYLASPVDISKQFEAIRQDLRLLNISKQSKHQS